MAPLTPRVRAIATPFICDSCLGRVRLSHGLNSRTTRYLSLSSASTNHQASSRFSVPSSYVFTRAHTSKTHQFIQPTQPRRQYATDFATKTHPPLAAKGLTPLPNRRLVSLSGPDAAKFLQGLVTNSVDPHGQSSFYCAFLNARGRVLWEVFIWVLPEGGQWACYIEVDSEEVDALLQHLRRHKLRSKINIALVPENEVGVWSAWGLDQEQLQGDSLIAYLPDPRAPGFGIRCLLNGDQGSDDKKTDLHLPVVDTQQYHIRRYLYGIPEGPREIQREGALPMEFNFDLSDAIDFKKGCYVGQELTIRTKHTGVVRKRVLPIQLYHPGDTIPEDQLSFFDPASNAADLIETGTDIKPVPAYADPKKVRAAGKFIAGAGNVGLALCRLEMMTDMRVNSEGVSVRPGAEFIVQSSDVAGNEIRIKAIVPQWLRDKESAVWHKERRVPVGNMD